ncbi:peptidase dimerization domain-containing protein [Streptomyces sp. 372A]
MSVTAFHGGQGFSVTPDRVDINVDVRTAPGFDAHDAETLVRKAVAELDAELPAPAPTEVTPGRCLAAVPSHRGRTARRRPPRRRHCGRADGAGEDGGPVEHRQPARRGGHRGHRRFRGAVRGPARHRRTRSPRRTPHGVRRLPEGLFSTFSEADVPSASHLPPRSTPSNCSTPSLGTPLRSRCHGGSTTEASRS